MQLPLQNLSPGVSLRIKNNQHPRCSHLSSLRIPWLSEVKTETRTDLTLQEYRIKFPWNCFIYSFKIRRLMMCDVSTKNTQTQSWRWSWKLCFNNFVKLNKLEKNLWWWWRKKCCQFFIIFQRLSKIQQTSRSRRFSGETWKFNNIVSKNC